VPSSKARTSKGGEERRGEVTKMIYALGRQKPSRCHWSGMGLERKTEQIGLKIE